MSALSIWYTMIYHDTWYEIHLLLVFMWESSHVYSLQFPIFPSWSDVFRLCCHNIQGARLWTVASNAVVEVRMACISQNLWICIGKRRAQTTHWRTGTRVLPRLLSSLNATDAPLLKAGKPRCSIVVRCCLLLWMIAIRFGLSWHLNLWFHTISSPDMHPTLMKQGFHNVLSFFDGICNAGLVVDIRARGICGKRCPENWGSGPGFCNHECWLMLVALRRLESGFCIL